MSSIDYVVSDKPMESKEEEALWHYNLSRERDGLLPLKTLPPGTQFLPIPFTEEAFNAQFEEWKGDSDGTVGVD